MIDQEQVQALMDRYEVKNLSHLEAFLKFPTIIANISTQKGLKELTKGDFITTPQHVLLANRFLTEIFNDSLENFEKEVKKTLT